MFKVLSYFVLSGGRVPNYSGGDADIKILTNVVVQWLVKQPPLRQDATNPNQQTKLKILQNWRGINILFISIIIYDNTRSTILS